MKLSLMVTCLGDIIHPEAGRATVRLLRKLGHEVDFPQRQTCCGQPLYNSGFLQDSRRQAQHTIEVFADSNRVIVPSGSCAAMVKAEYPRLFEQDPSWHERARELAAKTFELSDFLVNQEKVVDVGASFFGKVTYHFACHLRALGATGEAETLIKNVRGVTFMPLDRLDQCCGFGGSFSVRYPQISGALVNDKSQCVMKTEARAVISTDMGCLMNIGGRLRRLNADVSIMHLAELLDQHELDPT